MSAGLQIICYHRQSLCAREAELDVFGLHRNCLARVPYNTQGLPLQSSSPGPGHSVLRTVRLGAALWVIIVRLGNIPPRYVVVDTSILTGQSQRSLNNGSGGGGADKHFGSLQGPSV